METSYNNSHIKIVHVCNAPPETVFKAWTDPDLLSKWFAPNGCTIIYKKLELRKGGTFLSCISNPDFGDCWCRGVYTEIIFPERIEYVMSVSDENGNIVDPIAAGMDPNWPQETKVIVTFEEQNGKTRLTLYQDVDESLAKKTGAHPSWIQMLERLESEILNPEIA